MYMIKVAKNPNFPQFIEIWEDRKLIDEVSGRRKALRIALKLAKKVGEKYILFNKKIVEVK